MHSGCPSGAQAAGIAVVMIPWLFGSIMSGLTFSALGWSLQAPVLAERLPAARRLAP